MSDTDRYFHEVWLGMVQPIDGLVVSIPVLVDAQCMERQPPHVQQKLLALCPPTEKGEAGPEGFAISDLGQFFSELLGLTPELFDVGDAIPEELSLYVPEGRQTLRPTMALKKQGEVEAKADGTEGTPASRAGSRYDMLVWDLPKGLDLDKPETTTGTWDYPPSSKFDRLLRHCRVPIGLLTNRDAVRLIYAPYGESSGAITFRLDDMASVGGRPILDALVMLLSANRFFGVSPERSLPALLEESRKRQANVTNDLADQVFEALQILLRGFEAAAERDGRDLLDDALAREHDHLYKGLLTVLLRLVFLLYAEDRGLLPIEQPTYAEHLSVLELFEQLQADRGAYPDSMSRRFGAWGRLVTVFRAIFLGVEHGPFKMPPRRGSLFNPHEYPFLEGWGPAGSAPITQAEDRASVKLPTVDDETVFRVLEKLLVFEGQRLSYRALDVEQIGSVYEALMGYHVVRLEFDAVAIKLNSKPSAARGWVECTKLLAQPASRRAVWLDTEHGFDRTTAKKIELALESLHSADEATALDTLTELAVRRADDRVRWRAAAGRLVLQPGLERRRTSSHYTPRSLSAPIVRRALDPLLAVMGEKALSDRILNLKVCDPAMGSGAFLVEACRFLADRVLSAWTKEGRVADIAAEHGDPLLHARRLVAQRCLYGVDKNEAAVELAKLSLWLVTLSRTLPFTFLDHSLRHGDSLVGLDFDQIRAFHWKSPARAPSKQLELFGREIAVALDEAILLRQRIGELGDSSVDDREKARLFWDAQDALDRIRLIGDIVVGAFFAHDKDVDREAERTRREALVRAWVLSGGAPTNELLLMQRDLREQIPVFHWMAEFPEIFYAERPDPLDDNEINRAAYMDAFIGNPPFLSLSQLRGSTVQGYGSWLRCTRPTVRDKADLVAHFFRRGGELLGLHGVVALIATKTISEGDTRDGSLRPMIEDGFVIYSARRSFQWPGDADVSAAIVHLARGCVVDAIGERLHDDQLVATIDASLRAHAERGAPTRLAKNQNLIYSGVRTYSEGFVLSPNERDELITHERSATKVTFEYLGGTDINSRARESVSQYVIWFRGMSLDEAGAWPVALSWVRKRVKPGRDDLGNSSDDQWLKQHWWRFHRDRDDLRDAIAGLQRCIVMARDPKHICFTFNSTSCVFNDKVFVVATAAPGVLATLQSRVHVAWALRQGRTTGSVATPSYSSKRCFDTFPFPRSDPRTVIPALETIGRRLYDVRAQYMGEDNVGLTITYNHLRDPACDSPRILELRRLHEELDHTVLEAYAESNPEGRWLELELPPFCPMNDEDKKKLERFEDAVIDRLFVLNARRAEEEKIKWLGAGGKKKGPAKKAAADGEKKPRARKKKADGQLALGTGEES